MVEGFFANSASIFNRAGLSPNMVTFLGFAMVGLAAIFYALGLATSVYWVLSIILLLLAGYFDALDGAMARHYRRASKIGGVLDSVFDRIGEALLYSGIAIGGLVSYPLAFWALSASFLVSYVRARVEVEGVTLKGVGIAERPERILIILVTTILIIVYRESLFWGVAIVAVLSTVTVGDRIIRAWETLSRKDTRN